MERAFAKGGRGERKKVKCLGVRLKTCGEGWVGGRYLLVLLENSIRLALGLSVRVFDLKHAVAVARESGKKKRRNASKFQTGSASSLTRSFWKSKRVDSLGTDLPHCWSHIDRDQRLDRAVEERVKSCGHRDLASPFEDRRDFESTWTAARKVDRN